VAYPRARELASISVRMLKSILIKLLLIGFLGFGAEDARVYDGQLPEKVKCIPFKMAYFLSRERPGLSLSGTTALRYLFTSTSYSSQRQLQFFTERIV
jgi:hypothetical protein